MNTWRTSAMLRPLGLLILMSLIALACGSNGEATTAIADTGTTQSTEVPAAAAEPAAASTSTPVPEPEPTTAPLPEAEPTPEPTPTPIPVDSDALPIEQLYEDDPVDGGWPVAAGRWSSSSFSTPISFELTADARLLTNGLGNLEFAFGPADDPRGWLLIVEPIAVNRPTGPIPIDLVDPDAAFEGTTIVNERTEQGWLGELSVFDFVPDLHQNSNRLSRVASGDMACGASRPSRPRADKVWGCWRWIAFTGSPRSTSVKKADSM